MNNTFGFFFRILLLFSLIATSHNLSAKMIAEDEVITAIILIDRKAELVDLNKDGDILTRHMAVPDYFSPRKSHRVSLRESLRKLKMLGEVDHSIPGSSTLPVICLQATLLDKNETKDASSIINPNTQNVIAHFFLKVENLLQDAEFFDSNLSLHPLAHMRSPFSLVMPALHHQKQYLLQWMPFRGTPYNKKKCIRTLEPYLFV